MIIRDDIPLGFTYDVNGRVLTSKNSNGYWYECTRDFNGNTLTYKNSRGSWSDYTYDDNGNILTYKNSNGYWSEYTRDVDGKVLTYKNSNGHWSECTYDFNGNTLTYKDSNIFNGALMTKIAGDSFYTLMITEKGQVTAGCREFDNVEDALKHWDRKDKRAILFTKALKEYILNERK